MTSVNDIKTLALKELGRSDVPDFLDTTQPDVLNLNLHYPLIYKDCLGKHKWRFAKEVIELAPSKAPETGRWLYQYDLPEDVICVRSVFADATEQTPIRYEWRRKKIYTNAFPVYLCYTTYVSEDELPTWFVMWFKYCLAVAVCLNTTGDSELLQYLERQKQISYSEALNQNSIENGPVFIDTGSFINCR